MKELLLISASSWAIIIPLLLMCIAASYNEWETDVLFGFGGLFVILYNVGVTWSDIHWYHAVAYFAIGVSWCLFRYREFIKETAVDYKEYYSISQRTDYVQEFKNRVAFSNNRDKLRSWFFNWTFSMFVYFTGNFFTLFDKLVLDKITEYFTKYIDEKAKEIE